MRATRSLMALDGARPVMAGRSHGRAVLLIFVMAFYERGIYGGVDWNAFTFDNFSRAVEWLYLGDLPRFGAHRRPCRR